MPIATILLLFAAGFFSGVVNAIAGGGTFLTFGALTLAGLPPIAANATSSITQFPGYVTSTLAYLRELKSFWQGAVVLALVSAAGALAGALLLVSLSNPTFRAMVPWLLIAATAVFAAGPKLRPKTVGEGHPATPLGLVLQTLTAFYGGFFGAGMGIMMLASLGLASGGDYHRLNALKNFLSIVIAAVAISVFATAGAVSWTHALVMVPAVALGGYAGVSLARRVPQSILRFLVVAAGLLLAVYYFLTG
ncbi:sulfite exporter TauE/SafE family protein [Rhizobium daejeonense]|uniref:Probable membrane transporter protein n=1 Tax=Rhizobium daejeonense TaxID=240521 RepID=A0A6M1S4R0_9HYPH|nr:sulfite exporter TauE/SafE family protein [Rhizobium daejeonense]NGO65271.1 sulfite exporter TauE/SafE family protein [Rhizobium daejeonense]